MKKYIVDIDGTIANTPGNLDYTMAHPIKKRIDVINKLYDEGNYIKYWTARGTKSGIDWYDITHQQLLDWGCRFHELEVKKPFYDVWIDDRAFNAEELDNNKDRKW